MIRLSFSNIAWAESEDAAVYEALASYGFSGLEMAPTRWFPAQPYTHAEEAACLAAQLKEKYGLAVSSMQSIWYGRTERLFGCEQERNLLREYTRQAMHFAAKMGCKNLVFGCPKNRFRPEGEDESLALDFFRETGKDAVSYGCVFALEANPPLYQTNYLNTTREAYEAAGKCPEGVGVNLDFGTILCNRESLEEIACFVPRIHHVHISEPNLAPIQPREEHRQLASILRAGGYDGYVSAEMKKAPFSVLVETMKYLAETFA